MRQPYIPYTQEEDTQLLELRRAGVRYATIARQMPGRSTGSLNRRYSKLNSEPRLVIEIRKKRKCLSCGVKFMSWGRGNHLCNECGRESLCSFDVGYAR